MFLKTVELLSKYEMIKIVKIYSSCWPTIRLEYFEGQGVSYVLPKFLYALVPVSLKKVAVQLALSAMIRE
jgi:hypothetical protein